MRVVADSNLEGRTQWKIGRTWAETILDCALRLAQATEIGMPEVRGTDAEQAAIWQVLNRYKHVFGPPPVGGSKLPANVN